MCRRHKNCVIPKGFILKWKPNLTLDDENVSKFNVSLQEYSLDLMKQTLKVYEEKLVKLPMKMQKAYQELDNVYDKENAKRIKGELHHHNSIQKNKIEQTKKKKLNSLLYRKRNHNMSADFQSETSTAYEPLSTKNEALHNESEITVKGDGNCFFRCISFNLMVQKKITWKFVNL